MEPFLEPPFANGSLTSRNLSTWLRDLRLYVPHHGPICINKGNIYYPRCLSGTNRYSEKYARDNKVAAFEAISWNDFTVSFLFFRAYHFAFITRLRLLTYANWQEKVADPFMRFRLSTLTWFLKEQAHIIIELAANVIYKATFSNDAKGRLTFSRRVLN